MNDQVVGVEEWTAEQAADNAKIAQLRLSIEQGVTEVKADPVVQESTQAIKPDSEADITLTARRVSSEAFELDLLLQKVDSEHPRFTSSEFLEVMELCAPYRHKNSS